MCDQSFTPDGVTTPAAMDHRGRVAGKSLLAISAVGMVGTLWALWTGHLLEAAAILLGTILTLEMMLRRAIARFHGTGREACVPALPGLPARPSTGYREKKLFNTAPATPSSAACSMDCGDPPPRSPPR